MLNTSFKYDINNINKKIYNINKLLKCYTFYNNIKIINIDIYIYIYI